MKRSRMQHATLIEKLSRLRPERRAEVEDFIDFLHALDSDRRLAEAAVMAREPASGAVWDNDPDAEYDRL